MQDPSAQFVYQAERGGKFITVVPLTFGRGRICVAAADNPHKLYTYDTGF